MFWISTYFDKVCTKSTCVTIPVLTDTFTFEMHFSLINDHIHDNKSHWFLKKIHQSIYSYNRKLSCDMFTPARTKTKYSRDKKCYNDDYDDFDVY